MKRYKNNDWDEEECWNIKEFLKVEEDMWSRMYPGQAPALVEEDEVGDKVTSDFSNEGDNLSHFLNGHGNTEVINLPEPRIPDTEIV